MFTGLVQGVAEIISNKPINKGARLVLKFPKILKKIIMGESIALNGCCLTVVGIKQNNLSFDVSDETLRKTTLGQFQIGQKINFERALRMGDALGGHFVLGHVDGVAAIKKMNHTGGSLEIDFAIPKQLIRYIIDKGSVSLDGISLTVSVKPRNMIRVYIIPHTEKVTNIGFFKVGTLVNLEVDMLGKYVEKILCH